MGKNYVFGNPPSAVAPALICVLLWSTVASGFKLGLEHFAVEQLLFLGTCISWLVFLCYAIVTNQLALAASDRALAVGLGLINPTAYYLILFAAYDRLPAHIAQPINYTWAITLALLAVPILGQRLTLRSLWGILTSYLGVVILVTTTPGRLDQSVPRRGSGLTQHRSLGQLLAIEHPQHRRTSKPNVLEF